jgi:hypothetical protein
MITSAHASTSLLQISKSRELRAQVDVQKDARAGVDSGVQPQKPKQVSANVENIAIQKAADAQKAIQTSAPREGLRENAETILMAQQQKTNLAEKSSASVNAYKAAEKLKQTETASMPDSAVAISRKQPTEVSDSQSSTLPEFIQTSNEALNNSSSKVNAAESARIEHEAQSANGNDSLAREQHRLDASRYQAQAEPEPNKVDRSA